MEAEIRDYLICGVIYSLFRIADGYTLLIMDQEGRGFNKICTFFNFVWFCLSIYMGIIVGFSSHLIVLPIVSILLFIMSVFAASKVSGTIEYTYIYSPAVAPLCISQGLVVGTTAVIFLTL